MINPLTYASVALSFLVTLYCVPKWIRSASLRGFTGIDMNKPGKREVPEAGGICVVLGFLAGFFSYIAFQVFVHGAPPSSVIFSFATATVIILAALIGFVDDVLGWRKGLSQRYKFLLTLFIPLPVMVINAGTSVMELPFIGEVHFGILFPLLIVPIIIVGAANGFNILAGYNGLEAGMGVIITSTLGFLSYSQGAFQLAALCATMVASLLAFLVFNRYPARIFPGDTMTYSVGALIGVTAVIANLEKFAFFLFIPYFLELLLKLRGGLKKGNWATASRDGKLKNRYGKWYGLPNAVISLLNRIKGAAYEYEVVGAVWLSGLIFSAIALLSYYRVIPI